MRESRLFVLGMASQQRSIISLSLSLFVHGAQLRNFGVCTCGQVTGAGGAGGVPWGMKAVRGAAPAKAAFPVRPFCE